MAVTIIESGLASRVTEPRGIQCLEGYGLVESYRFERCEGEKERRLNGETDPHSFRVSRRAGVVVLWLMDALGAWRCWSRAWLEPSPA